MSRIDDTTRVIRLAGPRPGSAAPVRSNQGRAWPVVLVTATAMVIGGVGWAVVGADRDGTDPAPVVGAPAVLVHAEALDSAAATYRDYVVAESAALRAATGDLVAAVTDRRAASAKAVYPRARAHWERIQIAAEAVGELGDDIDGQGVGLDPGETFAGFHRIERDLWQDGFAPDTDAVAATLLADVTALAEGVASVEFTGHDLCGTAKELIDFAVVTALTGRENRWADTDVADLAARVEGSRAAVEALRPLLAAVDPALLTTLDRRFAQTFAVLDAHRVDGVYRLHGELTPADLKDIAVVLDALGEPVSRLGATVMV